MKKHSQRRWREVPKDELDALSVSRQGNYESMSKAEREAGKMRKRNKTLQGRRDAAKKKESNENKN
jgi:hypothetical protein